MPSAGELEKLLKSGKRLNVYQGFDPTAPTLHIGHAIGMRKLRDFQMLGHNVIFLFGDFTARIGDPTDKASARQQLAKEEVEENLKNYKEQASRILDFDSKENPVQVKFNSEWNDNLTFEEVIQIASEFTVQQMLKRDMFQERLKKDRPIHLHEFLYPMTQGYDSVVMDIDVEVGGNDQVFNMLAGRDLVKSRLNKEKFVLPVKLLTDPAGAKMSKTSGNMIMLSDSPEDIFGKIMAFTDGMITLGFKLLTDIPMAEIEQMQKDMDAEKVNPMELKKRLGFMVTEEHHGKEAAEKAQEHFEKLFQEKDDIKKEDLPQVKAPDNVGIIKLIAEHTNLASSNSEAKRLIEQNAVTLGEEKITDKTWTVSIPDEGILLRVGKNAVYVIK